MKRGLLKCVLPAILMAVIAVNAAAGGSQTPQTGSPAQTKKTFSIVTQAYTPVPPDVDVNNSRWANVYKRELPDIDINWMILPGDTLQQRLNIMIGSGNPPDTFPMSMAQMIQWSEQGIIQPLDGIYQNSYKNIYNFLTEDDLKSTRYNGRTYGIAVPGSRLANPVVMFYRSDWLEKLKLPVPRNVDEVYNMLRAFTFDDPDGNGVDDTYGVAGALNGTAGFSNMWQLFNMFGVQPGTNFTWVGNQIVPDFIRPEMREAVAFLARLYRDGIMDKDTLVMTGRQQEDKIVRGTVGMIGAWSYGVAVRVLPNMLAANPNAKFELFVPPPAPDGKILMPIGRNGGGMWGVASRCTSVDAIVYFFNWLIEQDTSRLPLYTLNADRIFLGEIGVDSAMLGNKFVIEMPQDRLTPEANVNLWRLGYRTHMGTTQAVSDDLQFEVSQIRVDEGFIHPLFLTAQQQASKYGVPSAVAITGPAYAEYMTDINTYWEETIASIITGARPITAFDDFVRFFYANGGQRIIDEVTALNR